VGFPFSLKDKLSIPIFVRGEIKKGVFCGIKLSPLVEEFSMLLLLGVEGDIMP